MAQRKHGPIGATAALALVAVGCASSPAAPFNQMPSSNLTAFRLQNYEPPAQAAATQQQAGGLNIPGLPPQIQNWIQQGAQGLQQLIPPGLLPPGMLGQQGAAAAAPAPQPENVPRFHGFRILGQTQVIDQNLKEELAEILGDEDKFGPTNANCMYAEMGLSFSAQPGAMSNDVLISFSCNQLASPTFAWPHPYTGMKSETVQELAEVVQKLFPPGT